MLNPPSPRLATAIPLHHVLPAAAMYAAISAAGDAAALCLPAPGCALSCRVTTAWWSRPSAAGMEQVDALRRLLGAEPSEVYAVGVPSPHAPCQGSVLGACQALTLRWAAHPGLALGPPLGTDCEWSGGTRLPSGGGRPPWAWLPVRPSSRRLAALPLGPRSIKTSSGVPAVITLDTRGRDAPRQRIAVVGDSSRVAFTGAARAAELQEVGASHSSGWGLSPLEGGLQWCRRVHASTARRAGAGSCPASSGRGLPGSPPRGRAGPGTAPAVC